MQGLRVPRGGSGSIFRSSRWADLSRRRGGVRGFFGCCGFFLGVLGVVFVWWGVVEVFLNIGLVI